MALEPVEVSARWKHEGRLEPQQFSWNGHLYRVEATGRDWEDEAGYHVLCQVHGGQVFELIFHLQPAGWLVRTPAGTSMV